MRDTSELGWHLVAQLTYITGRLFGPSAAAMHKQVTEWLEASSANRNVAERWLQLTTPDIGAPPAESDQSEEFVLRRSIEHALGERAQGSVGVRGHLRRVWWPFRRRS